MSMASQILALATRLATEINSVRTEMAALVPATRKVAGKALSSDVTIGAADLSATGTKNASTVLAGDNTFRYGVFADNGTSEIRLIPSATQPSGMVAGRDFWIDTSGA